MLSLRPHIPEEVKDLSLSKKIVVSLVKDLNSIHGTNEDEKYWQYLLLPFVQLFVERIVDRFQTIQINKHTKVFTEKQYSRSKKNCVNDSLSFFKMEQSVEDLIIFDIAKFLKISTKQESNISKFNFSNRLNFYQSTLKEFFRKIKREVEYVVNSRALKIRCEHVRSEFSIKNNMLILQDFLPNCLGIKIIEKYDAIRLKDLINCISISNRVVSYESKKFNIFRLKNLNVEGINEIESDYIVFIKSYFFSYLPSDYLENYKNIRGHFDQLKVKFLVGNSLVFWGSIERHAIADQISKGARVLTFQHGGGYGFSDLSTMGILEEQLSDSFISWTNTNNQKGLILRKSYFDIIEKLQTESNKHINPYVLILGPWFKQFHNYNEGLHPHDNKNVIKEIKLLISLLKDLNFEVMYRSYQNIGDEVSVWHHGKKSKKDISIYDQIKNAEFVVCCKPSTAVNDCLLLGIYPILFFGDEYSLKPKIHRDLLSQQFKGFYFDNANDCADEIFRRFSESDFDVDSDVKMIFSRLFGNYLATYHEIDKIISNFMVKHGEDEFIS